MTSASPHSKFGGRSKLIAIVLAGFVVVVGAILVASFVPRSTKDETSSIRGGGSPPSPYLNVASMAPSLTPPSLTPPSFADALVPPTTTRMATARSEQAEHDRITNLPGMNFAPTFEQFSGYFDVSESRSIFYWYVESQGNPATDPVILWTNGGPGCSGILSVGVVHGPYNVLEGGTSLDANPYSWNNVANVLYIEQPAFVGFSYGDSEADKTTNDEQAAQDNYSLILEFFKRYPERQSNPFHIASESYGGHYIADLTKKILEQNIDNSINFRGMMVGNPYVDDYTNTLAQVETFYHYGLLPKPLVDEWYDANCPDVDSYHSHKCGTILDEMFDRADATGLDLYGLDHHKCDDAFSMTGSMWSHMARRRMKRTGPNKERSVDRTLSSSSSSSDYNPCVLSYWTEYMNRPDVRSALHVESRVADKPWKFCTEEINYDEDDYFGNVIPIYQEIVAAAVAGKHDLNMFVYSGSDDGIVPLSGTQSWMWNLGVNPIRQNEESLGEKNWDWEAWKYEDRTAGFVTKFDLGPNATATLTFATVQDAGHAVPLYKPAEGLQLLQSYLSGDW